MLLDPNGQPYNPEELIKTVRAKGIVEFYKGLWLITGQHMFNNYKDFTNLGFDNPEIYKISEIWITTRVTFFTNIEDADDLAFFLNEPSFIEGLQVN